MGLIVGYISYAAAALAYLGLALFYLWRGGWGGHGFYLLAAALLTPAWAGLSFFGHDIIPDYAEAARLLRHLPMPAWDWLLWHLVASLEPHHTHFPPRPLLGWDLYVGSTTTDLDLLSAHKLLQLSLPRPTPPLCL